MSGLTEREAGVAPVGSALDALLRWIRPTFDLPAGARPTLDVGYFANVVPVAPNPGVAIPTDGVGTKPLVALDAVLTGDAVRAGDVLLGLESSGMHSNGYTLARRALLERGGLELEQHVSELGCSLAEELLRPTLIYVKPVMALLDAALPIH